MHKILTMSTDLIYAVIFAMSTSLSKIGSLQISYLLYLTTVK